ncbi:hypothetical protein [Ornithinimicrobium kibberense]|uniref:hypothetical protein n=1 Tax=Ornithinimicrobium kibberense TaxID=282060 RepID=UPI00360D3463
MRGLPPGRPPGTACGEGPGPAAVRVPRRRGRGAGARPADVRPGRCDPRPPDHHPPHRDRRLGRRTAGQQPRHEHAHRPVACQRPTVRPVRPHPALDRPRRTLVGGQERRVRAGAHRIPCAPCASADSPPVTTPASDLWTGRARRSPRSPATRSTRGSS